MTEGQPTKVCPLCAEAIKAAAKVCPFCQTRQSRWVLWAGALFQVAFPVVFVVGSIVFLAWAFPEEVGQNGRSFARHRGELSVGAVALDRAKTRPEFWLSGIVTNTGAYPWRVREMEVCFRDVRGNLFDVFHPTIGDPFVVEPGQDHAFRVSLGLVSWTNDAALPRVRVQTASDGHLPPKD